MGLAGVDMDPRVQSFHEVIDMVINSTESFYLAYLGTQRKNFNMEIIWEELEEGENMIKIIA